MRVNDRDAYRIKLLSNQIRDEVFREYRCERVVFVGLRQFQEVSDRLWFTCHPERNRRNSGRRKNG
ncbi:hypothetical protein [Rhizobium phaseoli]|uniref:hypothetical protein n=1 Tax=Rhizobium phaseoli TaxID=396 RepID=UPI00123768C0